MIKYRLHCDQDHAFDVWFRDSAAFDKQSDAGLLSCPECGSTKIAKALMAPNLASPKKRAAAEEKSKSKEIALAGMTPEMAAFREKLNALRTEIESNFDYVGKDFAEEARKIHYGETDPHGIYGETSQSEAEALIEEGIGFTPVPWLPKNDA